MNRVVGTSPQRLDAVAKVTGQAQYTVDIVRGGMLHAKVVRSSRPHARIVAIDASAALRLPGCAAVVTADDLQGLFPRYGHIVADHTILAVEKVRYVGEPVALVLGETTEAAVDASALVDVRYDDLPAAMTPEDALLDGAPLLHTESYERAPGSSLARPSNLGDTDDPALAAPSNIAHTAERRWGDTEQAVAGAAVVVETTACYPMLYAYAMEPYNALAAFTGGALEVISSTQHPFMVQRDLARVFSMRLSQVRVSAPLVGGGYGSKGYTKVEPLAAVGAWATRRPVKLVLDVEESIYTARVDASVVKVRSGFDADGRILAREFDLTFDTGAYADNSPLVLDKAVNRCFGPYRIPNLLVRGRLVYTNTAPADSYRGFGAAQGNVAGEVNIDQAADRLGMSPAEIRRRNLVGKGEEFIRGLRPMDADLREDLDLLIDRLGDGAPVVPGHAPLHGVGFGCSASDAGALPTSTAHVKVVNDGSVIVSNGSVEMGQGSRTVLAQIAAEELAVPLSDIEVVQSDTALTAFERITGASRTTSLAGLAVQRACRDLLEKLRAMSADGGAPSDDIPGILQGWFGSGGGEVVGIGEVRPTGDLAQLPPFWEIGMVGVGVSIDGETGEVMLDKLATVADVGYAINPMGVKGQDLGAATQGLGGALYEELIYEGSQLVNPNIVEYRVPRITDLARHIETVLAERRDGIGPYGAKGIGEGALNPMGGAVAAAVARAVGAWPGALPLTPERVWRLLRASQERLSEQR